MAQVQSSYCTFLVTMVESTQLRSLTQVILQSREFTTTMKDFPWLTSTAEDSRSIVFECLITTSGPAHIYLCRNRGGVCRKDLRLIPKVSQVAGDLSRNNHGLEHVVTVLLLSSNRKLAREVAESVEGYPKKVRALPTTAATMI